MEVFIHRDGQEFGPYSVEEIAAHLSDGSLLWTDSAWTEGLPEWVPLASLDHLRTQPHQVTVAGEPTPRKPLQSRTAPYPSRGLGPYARSTLQPNETVVQTTTIHPVVVVRSVIAAAVLALFIVALAIGASAGGAYGVWLLLLAPALLVLPGIIALKTSELVITDRRVIIKVGFLQRRTLEMFISKIESVAVHQSMFGRILRFGDVVIRGTGGSAEAFRTIADPIAFRNAIQRVQGQSEFRRPGR